jgi:PPOX class probable F420-dependent enzyme
MDDGGHPLTLLGTDRKTTGRGGVRVGRNNAGMDLIPALDYARPIMRGVLATMKADGRPQLSNIMFASGADGVVRISVTATRAKTANMRRDPRVSLHVTAADFWSYVVIEGEAELTPVAAAPDDATVDELVELYRDVQGEHPDWAEYRAAMVADERLVVRVRPTRAYGSLP